MAPDSIADRPMPFHGVLDDLLEQIERGDLRPGDKLLATSRLAEHYRVAVPTAHRALAELTRRGVLSRKTGIGTFVQSPRRKPAATSIAVVIRCDGHIWADVTHSLLEHLCQLKATTSTINVGGLSVAEILVLPAFLHLMENLPDIVIVQYTVLGEHILEASPDTHVISLEPHPGHRHLDLVAPDMVEVGALAARHLIERGHRRLDLASIFVDSEGPYRPDYVARAMRDGIDYELKQHALPPVRLIDIPAGADASDRLRDWLHASDRGTAVISSMAHRSAQIARLAREEGIRIPTDLAMVSAMESPWTEAYDLTAIDPCHDAMAALCVELIKETHEGTRGKVRHRRAYAVTPELIIRHST